MQLRPSLLCSGGWWGALDGRVLHNGQLGLCSPLLFILGLQGWTWDSFLAYGLLPHRLELGEQGFDYEWLVSGLAHSWCLLDLSKKQGGLGSRCRASPVSWEPRLCYCHYRVRLKGKCQTYSLGRCGVAVTTGVGARAGRCAGNSLPRLCTSACRVQC